MLKLLVVEDHTLVREGLVQTLRQLDEEITVLEAPCCDLACALLEEGHDFDLMLLDLGLPGIDGLTCLSRLRKRYPSLPVVIVSAYDDTHTVSRAMKAGASGFVPKAYSSERLLDALREVLDGRIVQPDRKIPAKLRTERPAVLRPKAGATAMAAEFGLTERKTEILNLLVRGDSNREIAEQLGLTEGTVKVHITCIFKALGVGSRTQALAAVTKFGIKL